MSEIKVIIDGKCIGDLPALALMISGMQSEIARIRETLAIFVHAHATGNGVPQGEGGGEVSERQPIDLDDLQRVGVLVREKTDDNWLADMVEIACDEIARLRKERRQREALWQACAKHTRDIYGNVFVPKPLPSGAEAAQ